MPIAYSQINSSVALHVEASPAKASPEPKSVNDYVLIAELVSRCSSLREAHIALSDEYVDCSYGISSLRKELVTCRATHKKTILLLKDIEHEHAEEVAKLHKKHKRTKRITYALAGTTLLLFLTTILN